MIYNKLIGQTKIAMLTSPSQLRIRPTEVRTVSPA
jgi:hypothetical protein